MRAIVQQINSCGAGIVWVGLGCPKQEAWMHAHRGRINSVMVGVGAAFDFHAGVIKRAPLWMQRSGLEWVHRMAQDPRRLVKRYLVTNTIFVIGIMQDFVFTNGPKELSAGSARPQSEWIAEASSASLGICPENHQSWRVDEDVHVTLHILWA
jgi:hypothetical protein